MKNIVLVTSKKRETSKNFQELIEHIKAHYNITPQIKYEVDVIEPNENSVAFLYLNDLEIKTFIKSHIHSGVNVAILPISENQKAQASYGIVNDIYEALDTSLKRETFSDVDVLLCNGEPVFTNVVIGEVHEMNNASIEDISTFSKIKTTYKNLKNLHFKEFTFTTAKEQVIRTAATGVLVFEHNSKQGHYNIINEDISLHDSQLNAFILSPSSLLSYIYYLFIVYFYNKFSSSSLPKSIGIIKTSKLNVQSPNPLDYKSDDALLSAKEIELEIIADAMKISLGKNIKDIPKEVDSSELKETLKIQSLPKGEIKNALISEKIPFFKKASDEDFKELFVSLNESSNLSSVYLVLMVLSTLLATTGLFQSSTPVIIGAMILAPLMNPIVSLAMGVVRGETFLIKNSSLTLFYGIGIALLFSCTYTYFIPLSTLTGEISARLNPNILDLMVAIISGIAGAYANSKSEVAKSLAGVAIAVALIPPLSVTGIGIGWGDWSVIYGSFLLFITNLVGITLAASMTFIVLGYAPLHRAKKGLVYTSIIMSIIAIPLIISFAKVIERNIILIQLEQNYKVHEKKLEINVLDVDLSSKIPILILETLSEEILDKNDLISLKERIETKLDKKIIIKVSSKVVIN